MDCSPGRNARRLHTGGIPAGSPAAIHGEANQEIGGFLAEEQEPAWPLAVDCETVVPGTGGYLAIGDYLAIGGPKTLGGYPAFSG